jgi:hypothetical protein
MPKHRSYALEFKRQVAQEYLAGETFHGLAKRHALGSRSSTTRNVCSAST